MGEIVKNVITVNGSKFSTSFGSPRPAPKPSQVTKKRGRKPNEVKDEAKTE